MNTVGNGENDNEFIDYLVSPVFHKIIKLIDYRIEKDMKGDLDYKGYDLPKYFIISGVANTCGAFMSFMKKYYGTTVKYANFSTNIHIELYLEEKINKSITENDYRIEYYYNDDFLLSIPYVEFKNKIKSYLIDQEKLNQFCKQEEEKKEDNKNTNWYLIGTIIASVIIIVIIIFIIVILKKRAQNNNDNNKNEEIPEDNSNLLRETNRTSAEK